jgi:phage gp29-like protein
MENSKLFITLAQNQADQAGLKKPLKTLDNLYNYLFSYVQNPDLKIRSKGIAVYDKTLADPVVQGCVDTIIQSIKALEYEIIANGQNKKEIDFINQVLMDLFEKGLRDHILMAVLYGNQYLELIWDNPDGFWYPVDISPRAHESFFYKKNVDTNAFELYVITEISATNGELVTPLKLLVPTFKASSSNPYGKGLLSNCYKSIFIKDNAWNFWSMFVEDHGTPKIDVEISTDLLNTLQREQNMSPDDVVLLIQEAAQNIRQNGNYTHLEGVKVTALQSGSSDNGITHEELMDYCDKQVAILLLGHNGSSQSTPGKLGSEDVALSVLSSRIQSYASFVEDNVNTLIKWIHNLNFGTGKAPQIRMFERDDVSMYKAKAEFIQILSGVGLSFTPEYYQDTFNIDKKYFNISAPKPPEPPATKEEEPDPDAAAGCNCHSTLPMNFTAEEKTVKDAVKGILTIEEFAKYIETSDEFADVAKENIKPVMDFIESCSSYEDMLDGLLKVYPKVNKESFIDLLSRMMAIANIYGYHNGGANG